MLDLQKFRVETSARRHPWATATALKTLPLGRGEFELWERMPRRRDAFRVKTRYRLL
jgi:hypothetical protein